MVIPTKQYLFRLYHTPISGTPDPPPTWNPQADWVPDPTEELHTNDYLCTFPEDEVDLARTASTLVYAYSCLLINTATWFVVVWQLSGDKPADDQTPVAVFHPYLMPGYQPVINNWQSDFTEHEYLRYWTLADFSFYEPITYFGKGFLSYNLRGTGITGYNIIFSPGPFYVLNITRPCATGKPMTQSVKRAVDTGDIFRSRKGNICLNIHGTLYRTRFPFFKQIMEQIPFQHSGWSLERDGSLKSRPIVTGERVAYSVSYQAQQRRMCNRHNHAYSQLVRAWFETARRFLQWFWFNQQFGYYDLGATTVGVKGTAAYGQYNYSSPPVDSLRSGLAWWCDFLNLAAIAHGTRWLVMHAPEWTEQQVATKYAELVATLTDRDGNFEQCAVYGETQQHALMLSMIQITGELYTSLRNMTLDLAAWEAMPAGVTAAEKAAKAEVYAAIQNRMADAWQDMVADFFALMGMLMTWQLTWDVAEPTRHTAAEGVAKTPRPVYLAQWRQHRLPQPRAVVATSPVLTGRIAEEVPYFTPFGFWPVPVIPPDFDTTIEQEAAANRLQIIKNEQAARAADEAVTKLIRRALRNQQIEELKSEWTLANVPNPNDPWDYRNWLDPKWRQNLQEPANAEFYYRFADVPAVIDGLSQLLFGSFRPRPGGRPKHPAIGLIGVLMQPLKTRITDEVRSRVYRWVKDKTLPYRQTPLIEYLGYIDLERLPETLEESDATYSPRQIWPGYGGDW